MHQHDPLKYGDGYAVSVGGEASIRFAETSKVEPFETPLADGSAYAMTGPCREKWFHGVTREDGCTTDRFAL